MTATIINDIKSTGVCDVPHSGPNPYTDPGAVSDWFKNGQMQQTLERLRL